MLSLGMLSCQAGIGKGGKDGQMDGQAGMGTAEAGAGWMLINLGKVTLSL